MLGAVDVHGVPTTPKTISRLGSNRGSCRSRGSFGQAPTVLNLGIPQAPISQSPSPPGAPAPPAEFTHLQHCGRQRTRDCRSQTISEDDVQRESLGGRSSEYGRVLGENPPRLGQQSISLNDDVTSIARKQPTSRRRAGAAGLRGSASGRLVGVGIVALDDIRYSRREGAAPGFRFAT
jgi:hypothetical protein